MQQEIQTPNKSAKSEATRLALLAAARKLFAEKGYAETSTPEIVAATGVTRGALYHHFNDKLALFRAVVAEEYATVARQIEASAAQSEGSAMAALLHGSRGYLDAMGDQGRVRIMLRDGPAVLGLAELERIDRATSADSLRQGLGDAMQRGEIDKLPLGPLTSQLSALFDRAALAISEGDEPQAHFEVLERLLRGLACGAGTAPA